MPDSWGLRTRRIRGGRTFPKTFAGGQRMPRDPLLRKVCASWLHGQDLADTRRRLWILIWSTGRADLDRTLL